MHETVYSLRCQTSFGEMLLTGTEDVIRGLHLPNCFPILIPEEKNLPVLQQAVKELLEYCAGFRRVFDLPLEPHGTEFQRLCWSELCRIPYGSCISYGELARRIGKPGAARAVGQANHNNPIAIMIPCHRVIAANGSLGGYGGGLSLKRRLLELEKQ